MSIWKEYIHSWQGCRKRNKLLLKRVCKIFTLCAAGCFLYIPAYFFFSKDTEHCCIIECGILHTRLSAESGYNLPSVHVCVCVCKFSSCFHAVLCMYVRTGSALAISLHTMNQMNPLVPRVQKIKIRNLTLNRLLIVELVKKMVYLGTHYSERQGLMC